METGAPPAAVVDGRYEALNAKLVAHFFNEDRRGRPVLLYITEEELAALESSKANLAELAVQGPIGSPKGNICQKALAAFKDWRKRSDTPPYLVYLALFVSAADLPGDFASHGYYSRLRALTKEPGAGQPQLFPRMGELWQDLEAWSCAEKGGVLGQFRVRSRGKWQYVGLPKGQLVLSPAEQKALPAVFAEAGLEPGAALPESLLAYTLLRHGKNRLRPATLQTLAQTNAEEDDRDQLLALVADCLEAWDGSSGKQGERRLHGALLLCATLDLPGRRAVLQIRCSTRHELPEGGLLLAAGGKSYSAIQDAPGFTTPLADADGILLPTGTIALASVDGKWEFALRETKARVLVSGAAVGVDGLVEIGYVPGQQPFWLFISDPDARIDAWLSSSCKGVSLLDLRQGLPAGWSAIKVERAESPPPAIPGSPNLAVLEAGRIIVQGGLHAETGQTYLAPFPPTLYAEGAGPGYSLLVDGQKMPSLIARLAPRPGIHSAELRNLAEETIQRRRIVLVDPGGDPHPPPVWAPANESPGLRWAGALADGNPGQAGFPAFPFEIGGPVVLLGAHPGQVETWNTGRPLPWAPAWAITRNGKRRRAHYLGSPAMMEDAKQQRKLVLRWKRASWNARRRTTCAPQHAARWAEFCERARHA